MFDHSIVLIIKVHSNRTQSNYIHLWGRIGKHHKASLEASHTLNITHLLFMKGAFEGGLRRNRVSSIHLNKVFGYCR